QLAGFGDVEVDVTESAVSHTVDALRRGEIDPARHAGVAVAITSEAGRWQGDSRHSDLLREIRSGASSSAAPSIVLVVSSCVTVIPASVKPARIPAAVW